jgi:hypothetical protein
LLLRYPFIFLATYLLEINYKTLKNHFFTFFYLLICQRGGQTARSSQKLFFLNLSIKQNKQGVCQTVAVPFTLKRILRQKRNYGNSNIIPCNHIIFKKSSKRNQNSSRCYNSITNLKSQHKPEYPLSKILISK